MHALIPLLVALVFMVSCGERELDSALDRGGPVGTTTSAELAYREYFDPLLPPPELIVRNDSQFPLLDLRFHADRNYTAASNLLSQELALRSEVTFVWDHTANVTIMREKVEHGELVAMTTPYAIERFNIGTVHLLKVFDESFRLSRLDDQPLAPAPGDRTPPSFKGLGTLGIYSTHEFDLSWERAADDVTPYYEITYEVCVSQKRGNCSGNFVAKYTSPAGAIGGRLGVAWPGEYFLSVRAVDHTGNKNSNAVERQVDTADPRSAGDSPLASGTTISKPATSGALSELPPPPPAETLLPTPSQEVSMSTLLTESTMVAGVASGSRHTCALLRESQDASSPGRPICWGENSYGQLGNGTTVSQASPVIVSSTFPLVDLAAGSFHTCGRTSNGHVYCWGRNDRGQLGDGTHENRLTPVHGAVVGKPVMLAAGEDHTCELAEGGRVYCWGGNKFGQLGAPTTEETPKAVIQVPVLTAVSLLAAGDYHTCAIEGSGIAHCWGLNSSGQLGDGTLETRFWPTPVAGGTMARGITAGAEHTCMFDLFGAASCWGRGSEGQLGLSRERLESGGILKVATEVPVETVVGMAAGRFHTCANLEAGSVWCWGSNAAGQLGAQELGVFDFPFPTAIVGAKEIVAGSSSTCALLEDDTLRCWGAGQGL